LEKEIMRLQEVLKERETEISMLEESLKESVKGQSISGHGSSPSQDSHEVNGVLDDIENVTLSPKTMHNFIEVRKTMENGHPVTENGSVSETDESLDRLNELML
jgi:hypothetical protein